MTDHRHPRADPIEGEPAPATPSMWAAAAAAVFVACSWTWVIGMWLPVLLARDFGWPSFLAFAIPNVIGAASVAFAFASARSVDRFVEGHRPALLWFSAITVLFHLSVLSWRIGPSFDVGGVTPALGLLIVAAAASRLGPRGWPIAAATAYGLSIAMALGAVLTSGPGKAFQLPPAEGAFPGWALAATVPALCFGFLLCPHMDLTLLRARRETPGRRGVWAFVLGFGVLFLVMILMTLGYAGRFVNDDGSYSYYIIAHIAIQSVFTMGVHLRALSSEHAPNRRPRPAGRWWGMWTGLFLLGTAVVIAGSAWLPRLGDARAGYSFVRLGYDLFLAAYALVFPAYLWIVGAAPGARASTRRARLGVWAGAVVLAAPFFAVGALLQRHWALPIGVAIPLAAPLLLRLGRPGGGPQGAPAPSPRPHTPALSAAAEPPD